MKKSLLISALFLLLSAFGHAQDKYYFSDKKLNPAIPSPESFFGFRIGHSLVRYDKVVEYFKLLADKSDRASIEVFGKSYEGREQIAIIISSPQNQQNLENIRTEHLKLIDPAATVNINDQKTIVYLGYNVHGGEIAGTDASVVAAYYLVASEEEDIVNRLKETVVLVEPSLNPDGRDRAATFINGFSSVVPVANPADKIHSGGFVPHRGNHFFCDLNRDWLPLSQPESRNRVNFYHQWYPNIYLDFHEMGSASTYYFEPSPKPTWSPTIPQETYEVLNNTLARYFAQALTQIGSLYYTQEDFTNYSPIYGSTYPDFEGGVGTTLEVGATSGVEIETEHGIRTFSRNIKDNFEVSIAAVHAAAEKETFLNHQKNFFKSALTQADKQAEKYIVFGNKEDKSLNNLLINYLQTHRIEVYELKSTFAQDGKKFEPGSAYVIPYHQPHFRILNSIFEETTKYATSAFMDISAPSTAHGFGIQFAKVKGNVGEGAKITKAAEVKGSVEAQSDYAYAFAPHDYLTPKAVYYLQDNDVKVRIAQKEFTVKTKEGEKNFVAGTLVIPVHYQTVSPDKLYQLLNQAATLANIHISAIDHGLSIAGIDIGSNNVRAVKKPVIATVTGGSGYGGVNWTNVGELWSLLSNTHNIPLSKIDYQTFERADLSNYTAIVLTGAVPFTPAFVTRLTDWVERGGTLIATGSATQWLATSGIATGLVSDSTQNRRNADTSDRNNARRSDSNNAFRSGAILKGELNLSSPLSYGLTFKDFYVLKTGSTGAPRPTNPNNIVLSTAAAEIVHGYVPEEIAPKLKDQPIVVATARGQGAVVLFAESPTFRGYWLAPGRILTNALFYGLGKTGGREY